MKDSELTTLIGNHIRKLRTDRKLSQAYVADQLNMSVSNYGYIESGKQDITVTRIKELANVFDVEDYEILGYDSNSVCASKTASLLAEIKEYQGKLNKSNEQVITLQQQLIIKQRNDKLK